MSTNNIPVTCPVLVSSSIVYSSWAELAWSRFLRQPVESEQRHREATKLLKAYIMHSAPLTDET